MICCLLLGYFLSFSFDYQDKLLSMDLQSDQSGPEANSVPTTSKGMEVEELDALDLEDTSPPQPRGSGGEIAIVPEDQIIGLVTPKKKSYRYGIFLPGLFKPFLQWPAKTVHMFPEHQDNRNRYPDSKLVAKFGITYNTLFPLVDVSKHFTDNVTEEVMTVLRIRQNELHDTWKGLIQLHRKQH